MPSLRACTRLAAVILFGTAAFAASGDTSLSIPAGFQHWYLVNSMLVVKATPTSAAPGLHLIYINTIGFDRLTRGGATAYPDGTVFVDDVRDAPLVDGTYAQGVRKAIPVMVKDGRRYAATGGWGFQAWADGNPQKPIVTDAAKQCFACHASQASRDFTFSTYLR